MFLEDEIFTAVYSKRKKLFLLDRQFHYYVDEAESKTELVP